MKKTLERMTIKYSIGKENRMSKVNEILNNPDQNCSLCGTTFPFLLIKDEFTGEKYCSEKCMETDKMVLRADCEEE